MLLRLLKNPCIGFSLSMEEHQNIWKLQELLLRDCVQGVRGDEGKHDGQQHHLPQQVPRSKQYWDEHHCLWSFLVLQKCFNITEWKFLNQNDHQDLYHRGEDAGSIQERFREVVRKHKKGNQHIFDIYSTYGWNCPGRIFSPNIVTFFATLTPVFKHFLHWFYCFYYFYGSITCARVGKTKFLTRHLR